MILLIRVILIGTIIYLLARSMARFWDGEKNDNNNNGQASGNDKKGVSKEVGEYVDYEEVD